MAAERILITCTDSMMKQFLEHHVIFLSENGFDIEIACSEVLDRFHEVKADLSKYAKVHKLSISRSPLSRSNLKGYFEVRRLIRQGHYDYIWTNEPVMGFITRLAARKARKAGTKVLYMVHGFHFYKGAPKKNWLLFYPVEKWMARYTDKLITINEEDYAFAQKHFTCPVYHIHGAGANSAKFHPVTVDEQQSLRSELGFNGHIILTAGELNHNKNQKAAILALKKVLKRYPDTLLLIAGKGEEKDRLVQLVRNEGLENKVIFLGYTLQLEKYMQICDAEITCSYREGLGLNVIEAMLCGKPVAASRNRGHSELIRDGVNGYIVEADDPAAYAEKICSIFDNQIGDPETIIASVEPYKDHHVRDGLLTIFKGK